MARRPSALSAKVFVHCPGGRGRVELSCEHDAHDCVTLESLLARDACPQFRETCAAYARKERRA